MKANELTVGDWLYSVIDRYDHIVKKICKVVGIRTDCDITLLQCDNTDVWYSLKSYEPIPITPEILEKNGFVAKQVYSYPYYVYEVKGDKFNFEIALPKGNKTTYKEPWIYIYSTHVFVNHLPCVFVHQLQHALRLCGIEKEIIL